MGVAPFEPQKIEDGVHIIEHHTDWPCFGVIPWEPAALRLPAGRGADGARSADGMVEGTYLHGLFANDAYRGMWLERIGAGTASSLQYDAALDAVADTLSSAVDLDALFAAAGRPNVATGLTA